MGFRPFIDLVPLLWSRVYVFAEKREWRARDLQVIICFFRNSCNTRIIRVCTSSCAKAPVRVILYVTVFCSLCIQWIYERLAWLRPKPYWKQRAERWRSFEQPPKIYGKRINWIPSFQRSYRSIFGKTISLIFVRTPFAQNMINRAAYFSWNCRYLNTRTLDYLIKTTAFVYSACFSI